MTEDKEPMVYRPLRMPGNWDAIMQGVADALGAKLSVIYREAVKQYLRGLGYKIEGE
jgi:hypothetical protein